jgi:hypothetical protein
MSYSKFRQKQHRIYGFSYKRILSYSLPIWQGLHLENENVKTLNMVDNCEALDFILKQIMMLLQITSNNFIICILSTLNKILFQSCYFFSSLERYTIQTTNIDTATGTYDMEQCFIFSMRMCITNILRV